MDKLRVLLVDDESLARARMCSLLASCSQPAAHVVGEAASALAAKVWLEEHECDLVLLDIGMPGLSGLDLAAQLQTRANAPVVIFVTAHPEHALQAFDLAAVDYLTKPVRSDRLQAALARAAQRQPAKTLASPDAAQMTVEAVKPPEIPVVVVMDRGRVVRVPVSEVLYFKAELKYVTLRTAQHSYVLDDSLSVLERRVGPQFIRVHRNALVAKHAIRALEKRTVSDDTEDDGTSTWAVRVAPSDEWLAVSRRQVTSVREALMAERL